MSCEFHGLLGGDDLPSFLLLLAAEADHDEDEDEDAGGRWICVFLLIH
jgi:hypothetical protein